MPQTFYLALGDGITLGVGASQPEHAYTSRLTETLRDSGMVESAAVVAQKFWTIRHLDRACVRLPDDIWPHVRIASVLIGGNDLKRRYYSVIHHPNPDEVIRQAVKEISVDLEHLCARVDSYAIEHKLLLTQYNPFPRSALAERGVASLNRAIAACAERHGWTLVDLAPLFADRQSSLIAGYRTGGLQDLSMPFQRPLCPNDQGHELIAQAIRDHV